MASETEQTVGEMLRSARRARGLSLLAAEAACGVSKSTISEIELTKHGEPLPPSADLYAEFLEFQLDRDYRYVHRLRPRPKKSRRAGGR
jgi:transcriptional regulator with XRE-family HTH domain